MQQITELDYQVPDISCEHCVQAITGEVRKLPDVADVLVDVDTKHVTVRGDGIDDALIRAAIDEAGYDIAD